jgi:hypothetical protein
LAGSALILAPVLLLGVRKTEPGSGPVLPMAQISQAICKSFQAKPRRARTA